MLKPQEIAQISLALWYLPLPQLEQVKRLVLELKQKHGYSEPIDDSDEWTEEDLEDFHAASARHAEETMPYEGTWDEPEAGATTDSKERGESTP
jgi:hypothetical protein